MAVEVTDATFDGEVGSSPVVVEFSATWCGSCRRIAPVLAELAEEFRSRVRLVTVDADENPELVSRFGVSSTPTSFAVAAGERLASVVGARPVAVLRGLFEAAAGAPQGGCGCGSACGAEPTGWVPVDACTLPTADQPARLAEFGALFSSSLAGLHREEPGWLRLRFGGGAEVERRARELTAREAECCAFFDFAVRRVEDEVVVDVRVPAGKETVLDGLSEQAALAARV